MSEKICKTVKQYNSRPLPTEDMGKLLEIAEDYRTVKNFVYQKYGGVRSISKLYPGYTVQNEMTGCSLRAELGLPSVYYHMAVLEAVGDIKSQWAVVIGRVFRNISRNEGLGEDEKHYLRFVLKVSGCFQNILLDEKPSIDGTIKEAYEELSEKVETEKLNRYLKRQIRKKMFRLHTDISDGFFITERAYRYADHGIYLSTKERGRRIFIPLTDNNRYDRRLLIKLLPRERNIIICAPVYVRVKKHTDYTNRLGICLGMDCMATTDGGNTYGADYGVRHREIVDFIKKSESTWRREKRNNPGRAKYNRQKERLDAGLHGYVNAEWNRLLRQEKPGVIFIPGLPAYSEAGKVKKINRSVSLWQKGYVLERLRIKCRENGVELIEVFAKDIGRECSVCGRLSQDKAQGCFVCQYCGQSISSKVNAAVNVKKRGMQMKTDHIGCRADKQI